MTSRSVHVFMTALVGCAIVVAMNAGTAQANVYPSGLKPNTADVVQLCGTLKVDYVLNENAYGTDSLKGVKIEVIEISSGNAVRTIEIARQKKGKWVFEWDGRDDNGNRVANGTDAYRVRITAADYGYTTWTQTSDNNNHYLQFEQPKGVATNRVIDPVTRVASPYYGRIYVANSREATTETGRTTGTGFYLLNADQSDAVGQGDTVLTGGLAWAGANVSPWKIHVGPDEKLYIADYSDGSGGVLRVDPDAATGENVLGTRGDVSPNNHGSINGLAVSGTQATNDLKVFTIDEDYPWVAPWDGLYQYDINSSALPYTATPTLLNAELYPSVRYVQGDVDRGPDGKFYLVCYRAEGTDTSSLKIYDSTGTTGLWYSLPQTRTYTGNPSATDWCKKARSVAVSPDGARIAVLNTFGDVYLMPLVDGIPQLSGFTTLQVQHITSPAAGTSAQVAFDAAGNLYATSNITETVRIVSPPGGANSSITASQAFSLQKPGSGGPTIQTHPASVSVCSGSDATFTVVAANTTGTVHYTWKKDGAVVGSDSPSYTITGATTANDGAVVYVIVCDDNGVAVSTPAILSVGLTVTQNPAAQAVCAGGTANFSVLARGITGTPVYQWRKTLDSVTTNIGTDSPTLTLSPADAADNGATIDVVITDACGSVTSAGASLAVSTGPNFGVSGDKTGAAGTSFSYSVTLTSSTGTAHYQWHKTTAGGVTTDIGSDASIVYTTGTVCDNQAMISCTVTDTCGPTTKNVGLIIISPMPTEICGNEIDDDCNGLTDCDDPVCELDPGCCNTPWADAEGPPGVGVTNGDTDVDMDDFGVFQLCYTGNLGPIPATPGYCGCLDHTGPSGTPDGLIDALDFAAFNLCATGPNVPWVSNPNCP